MAYDIYLSSSLPQAIVVIIWFLVFYFIDFKPHLTFVEAVILILKHATFLRIQEYQEAYDEMNALTQAELNYQQANIDLKIQQYFMASSQKQSVKLFSEFIMATDIGSFILTSVEIISHHFYADPQAAVTHPSTDPDLSVPSQSSAEAHVDSKGKGRWLKRLWEPVFQRKTRKQAHESIFLPKLRDDE